MPELFQDLYFHDMKYGKNGTFFQRYDVSF